ncbi:MAG: hypothetical protein LBM96_09390 [Methanobrevibacter sp.]|nr:hypothetical protein [Candidatus Methanoflexus mossambicus]
MVQQIKVVNKITPQLFETPEDIAEYEYLEGRIQSYNAELKFREENGMEKGIKEVMKESIDKNMKEGMKERIEEYMKEGNEIIKRSIDLNLKNKDFTWVNKTDSKLLMELDKEINGISKNSGLYCYLVIERQHELQKLELKFREEEGKKIGVAIGKEIKRYIGGKIDREESRKIIKRSVALNFKKEGLDIKFISKITKLPIDEIKKL